MERPSVHYASVIGYYKKSFLSNKVVFLKHNFFIKYYFNYTYTIGMLLISESR